MEIQIAKRLLRINAIRLKPSNPFTWASGIKSPIYCDNRITLSHPTTRTFIKEGLVALAEKFDEFDYVAGVATAGIPHGALIADALNKPFIYVRSKAKEHGRQNMIEGEIMGGERVLVVEDLISTGKSSIQACDALKEVGTRIVGVVAIFSYNFQEAANNFEKAGISYKTLSNYEALLDEAMESGYINKEEFETLSEWRKDPIGWSKQFS